MRDVLSRSRSYLMSLVIDVTLGLALTYYLVIISNHVLSKAYTSRMRSGNYFKGVKRGTRVFYIIDYAAWIKQILIWLTLVMLVFSSDRRRSCSSSWYSWD